MLWDFGSVIVLSTHREISTRGQRFYSLYVHDRTAWVKWFLTITPPLPPLPSPPPSSPPPSSPLPRLRKQLMELYIVHPSFWVKTALRLARPFIRLVSPLLVRTEIAVFQWWGWLSSANSCFSDLRNYVFHVCIDIAARQQLNAHIFNYG